MSKTPLKSPEKSYTFVPKEVTTPNKDSPGISKTVYTHVSNLHHFLADWEKLKDNGSKICKSISALKLYECTDDYYPHQLKPLIESLVEALNGLQNVIEGVKLINHQLKALAQLDKTQEGVIFTWSALQISEAVDEIYDALLKEIKLKETVTENIAHCRNECLIEVYVSVWEFDTYYNTEMSSYLFADIGLSGIT